MYSTAVSQGIVLLMETFSYCVQSM